MNKPYLKKIIAQTPEDLQIISACCSEGIVKVSDIKYLQKNKIFLISINRHAKEIEKSQIKIMYPNTTVQPNWPAHIPLQTDGRILRSVGPILRN